VNIQKPAWMIYAEKVREEIDGWPARKGHDKRAELHLLSTWRNATLDMAYQGTLADWEYVVLRRNR
jgi:hypothetical protein